MAGGDYRSCDVCSRKTFYDANLQYDDGRDTWAAKYPPYRIVGKEQYEEAHLNQAIGLRLGYVGDWAVICRECAKTNKCVIVPRDDQPSGDGSVEK